MSLHRSNLNYVDSLSLSLSEIKPQKSSASSARAHSEKKLGALASSSQFAIHNLACLIFASILRVVQSFRAAFFCAPDICARHVRRRRRFWGVFALEPARTLAREMARAFDRTTKEPGQIRRQQSASRALLIRQLNVAPF
jgi:hypothetical protein